MDLRELKSLIHTEIEMTILQREQLQFQQEVINEQLDNNRDKLFKLENQLSIVSNEPELIVSIEEWLEPEQYRNYYPQFELLFEEGMFIQDWLTWFYEELPYIKDKHLSFIGIQTGKSYMPSELSGLIKADKKKQEIYVIEGEPVLIKLGSVNIFKLLSIPI